MTGRGVSTLRRRARAGRRAGTVAARGAAPRSGLRARGAGRARACARPRPCSIEGPPEADALVALAADEGMRPPVALLAHVVDEPGRSAFWPLAEFSPEWVAIRWALGQGVPVRFIDLPAAHSLALAEEEPERSTRRRRGDGRGRGGEGAMSGTGG